MSDDDKSQGSVGGGEATAAGEDNPFGVGNLDFDEARKRRERALEAKKAKEAESGDDDDDDIQVVKIGSLFDDELPLPPPKKTTPHQRRTTTDGSGGKSPPKKGGRGISRSTTDPTPDVVDGEDLMAQMAAMNDLARQQREKKNTIQVGDKTLTKWPYDHYHLVQKDYWHFHREREEAEKLKQQRQAADGHSESSSSVSISSSEDEDDWTESDEDSNSSSSSSSSDDGSRSETSEERVERKQAARRERKRLERRHRKKEEKKRLKVANRDHAKEAEARRKQRQKELEHERASGLTDKKSDILVFARPQDPPEIPHAVQGLPLTDFERVAKERAITKISTWLFDAGLVEELMQTKKMDKQDNTALVKGGKEKEHDGTPSSKKKVTIIAGDEPPSGKSKTPIKGGKNKEKEKEQQEGPKRTKMDIEIEKLEMVTRQQLDMANLRLKEGVASSGREVQELVNSVVGTKSELARLRQTSSMISNASDNADGVAGMASQQMTFSINKYPHLKLAINARRNLQKCFRELTIFSQIPETCAKLTDELNSSEWTEQEWSTLRNVCREHVKLEIFLVEAESGMKKRQDDEEEEDEEGGRGRQQRRASTSSISRKAFMDVGLPHNHDDVNRFLKEHVNSVWELGDEIRMKILSGIADAFQLAYNNPAGMVALVEAVEIYENANREYQAIHGPDNEGAEAKSLRFTDMRAVALGELYKDMEARGQEVFEGLSNSVRATIIFPVILLLPPLQWKGRFHCLFA
jgi:hypothetical protein